MTETRVPDYWFAAKRYGIGWGLPVRSEGWAVLLGYFFLVGAGIVLLDTRHDPVAFLAYLVVVTSALIILVAIKGEKPIRWRWGGK